MTGIRNYDEHYMRRALQLARCGEGFTSPNPMVGAVIVAPGGRIIGEGWHRRFGGPHAEVNAIDSVSEADRPLLRESTIYVTLEPCSHYGKTPPCAALLCHTGLRRAVIACADPNPKVSGRGLQMLREAGIELTTDVCRREALELNRRFILAQLQRRPYVQLKWARSADGFIAACKDGEAVPTRISSPLGAVWMHRERSLADAIIIGSQTAIADRPRLTLRLWPGRDKLKIVADRRGRVDLDSLFPAHDAVRLPQMPLESALTAIAAEHPVGSVMVEGGTTLLQSFIDEGLFDELRIEQSPRPLGSGLPEPRFSAPDGWMQSTERLTDGTTIYSALRPLP